MAITVVNPGNLVTPTTPHKVQRKNAASNQTRDNAKGKTKSKAGKKPTSKGHVDISV